MPPKKRRRNTKYDDDDEIFSSDRSDEPQVSPEERVRREERDRLNQEARQRKARNATISLANAKQKRADVIRKKKKDAQKKAEGKIGRILPYNPPPADDDSQNTNPTCEDYDSSRPPADDDSPTCEDDDSPNSNRRRCGEPNEAERLAVLAVRQAMQKSIKFCADARIAAEIASERAKRAKQHLAKREKVAKRKAAMEAKRRKKCEDSLDAWTWKLNTDREIARQARAERIAADNRTP